MFAEQTGGNSFTELKKTKHLCSQMFVHSSKTCLMVIPMLKKENWLTTEYQIKFLGENFGVIISAGMKISECMYIVCTVYLQS